MPVDAALLPPYRRYRCRSGVEIVRRYLSIERVFLVWSFSVLAPAHGLGGRSIGTHVPRDCTMNNTTSIEIETKIIEPYVIVRKLCFTPVPLPSIVFTDAGSLPHDRLRTRQTDERRRIRLASLDLPRVIRILNMDGFQPTRGKADYIIFQENISQV